MPNLDQLRRQCTWVWITCAGDRCGHRRPVALAPYVIRWGGRASSDRLRQAARCERCGHRGASITLPSWGGLDLPERAFPINLARR